MLITGIPDGDWSESEVIKIIQPFGNPTDIISASSLGKVTVINDTFSHFELDE